MSSAMKDSDRGEDIVRLLERFPAKPLGGIVQDLYNTARREMSGQPETSVRHCWDALDILENRAQRMLYPEEAAYTKGRFYLLLASIYLNEEKELEIADESYHLGRELFHSKQWCHLESLAYLGLAITRRKLAVYQGKSRRLKDAMTSCGNAQNCLENISVPSRIDVTDLRKAIEEESQKYLDRVQLPILHNIAAGVGNIVEDTVEETLPLYDCERNGADFGVRVRGDSMIEDGILPGSVALIRKQTHVKSGQIAAVVISTTTETRGVLKHFSPVFEDQPERYHWLLQSSNPASAHLVVVPHGADSDAIRVHYYKEIGSGRITSLLRYYRDAELAIAGRYVGFLNKD